MVFLNIKGNNSEYTYLMYNFDDRVLQRVLINNPRQFILPSSSSFSCASIPAAAATTTTATGKEAWAKGEQSYQVGKEGEIANYNTRKFVVPETFKEINK